MTEFEKAKLQEALGFFDGEMPLAAYRIIEELLHPGGTMGTAFTEAQEISQTQAAERRRNGEQPYRKPKPTRAEQVQYLIEDVKACVSSGELNALLDDGETAERLAIWWDQNHGLWLGLNEAIEKKEQEFERMGQCA